MRKFLWLTCLCLVVNIFAFSQSSNKRPNYKLLWKISGNGLTKPSYLFGTMHVQDNRAFDFNDSVLVKIQECKAFALEVHPDSAVRAIFTYLMNGGENKFKSLLNEKDYHDLDSVMRKKYGLGLDKLKSPFMARLMLEKKIGKKDKKVFLDAWLYNIARKSSKQIFGLEKISDQMDALETRSSIHTKNQFLESVNQMDSSAHGLNEANLFTVYCSGDIDALRNMVRNNEPYPGYYAKLIVNRNLVMEASIIKRIHEVNCFVAVGAAHLGGEEGLVSLLRKAGYTMTPVQAAFSGTAKKVKLPRGDDQWTTWRSEKGAYSLNMPSLPFEYKKDSASISVNVCADIGTGAVYQTFFTTIDLSKGRSAKSIVDDIEKRAKENPMIKTDKMRRYKVGELEALECVMTEKSNYYRTIFIARPPMLYCVQVGPDKETANSPDAERFLTSIKFENFPPVNWKSFSDKAGAFSIFFPNEVKTRETNFGSTPGTQQVLHIFYTSEPSHGDTFIARYHDLPLGHVSTDDTLYYKQVCADFLKLMKGTNLRQKKIMIDSIPACEFQFDAPGGKAMGRSLIRGSRVYLAIATIAAGTPETSARRFLDSFHLQEFKPDTLENQIIDGGMSLMLPARFAKDTTEHQAGLVRYYAQSPSSGINFLIECLQFSPFAQSAGASAFFQERNTLINKSDSMATAFLTTTGNASIQDVCIYPPNVSHVQRTRTVVHGQYVFLIRAFISKESRQPEVTDDVFESVSFTDVPGWSLYTDKTGDIFKSIDSPDSAIRAQALESLSENKMKEAAIPLIYDALKHAHADDTSAYPATRMKLVRKLKTVHDDSTPAFLKTWFRTAPDAGEVKDEILAVLASYKTEATVRDIIELIMNEKSNHRFSAYRIFNVYDDSLKLFSLIAPDVLNNLDKFQYSWSIFTMTKNVLDSVSAEPQKQLLSAKLIALGKAKLKLQPNAADVADSDDTKSFFAGLSNALVSASWSAETEHLFKGINAGGYTEAMVTTIMALLRHNASVDKISFEKVAADPSYHNNFYNELKDAGYVKLYPAAFLKQRLFAESSLWLAAYNEDLTILKSEFIKEITRTVKRQKVKLFVFKIKYPDDPEWYVGIAGPYSGAALTTDDLMTTCSSEKVGDGKDIDKKIAVVLDEMSDRID